MPAGVIAAAPLIGAGLSAAGVIGGAALSARGQNRATNAQLAGQREVLALERERDAERKAKEERAWEQYRQQYSAWESQRNEILKHYGIEIPGARGMSGNMSGGMMAEAVPTAGGAPGMAPDQLTIEAMMRGGGGAMPPMAAKPIAATPGTEGDPFEWSDWRRYGV